MARYCPKCYCGISPEDTICENCGAALEKEKTEEPSFDLTLESIDVSEEETETLTEEEKEDTVRVLAASDPDFGKEETTFSEEREDFDSSQPQKKGSTEALPKDGKVLSLGDWLITLILLCIPLVNFIMLIIWSVGTEVDPNKQNFARAQLIIMAIAIVLSIVMFVSMMGVFVSILNSGAFY